MPHMKPPFPIVLAIYLVLTALFIAAYCSPPPAYADDGTVSTQDTGYWIALPVPACPFYKGWNLVALNGSPGLLPACVSTVWEYDAVNDSWRFWGRENQPYWNDLASFVWGTGYWVFTQGGTS